LGGAGTDRGLVSPGGVGGGGRGRGRQAPAAHMQGLQWSPTTPGLLTPRPLARPPQAVLKCADGAVIWEGGDNKSADLQAGPAVELATEFTD
jgi:hypothetical protein